MTCKELFRVLLAAAAILSVSACAGDENQGDLGFTAGEGGGGGGGGNGLMCDIYCTFATGSVVVGVSPTTSTGNTTISCGAGRGGSWGQGPTTTTVTPPRNFSAAKSSTLYPTCAITFTITLTGP